MTQIERHLVCDGHGQFPVLIHTGGDSLAAVFRSHGGHYGLAGTLATAHSLDGGRTWSAPRDIAPAGDDIRNPAFGVVGNRWLLAYWQAGVRCYPADAEGQRRWRLPEPGTAHIDDTFVIASDDAGLTWSAPRAIESDLVDFCSPYGRILALADGTLMMAAYGPPRGAGPRGEFDAIVLRSDDGGMIWRDLAHVARGGSELALAALGDRVVGVVRMADQSCALVTSNDAGRTWNTPAPLTQPGEHPADICVLHDGRWWLTYGRRIAPLGCAARISVDAGANWSLERLLVVDGTGTDLGYPSTVQLADGALVTVLYFAEGEAVRCEALRYSTST